MTMMHNSKLWLCRLFTNWAKMPLVMITCNQSGFCFAYFWISVWVGHGKVLDQQSCFWWPLFPFSICKPTHLCFFLKPSPSFPCTGEPCISMGEALFVEVQFPQMWCSLNSEAWILTNCFLVDHQFFAFHAKHKSFAFINSRWTLNIHIDKTHSKTLIK